MKISQELKEYAEQGMAGKSEEFLESGGKVYLPVSANGRLASVAEQEAKQL